MVEGGRTRPPEGGRSSDQEKVNRWHAIRRDESKGEEFRSQNCWRGETISLKLGSGGSVSAEQTSGYLGGRPNGVKGFPSARKNRWRQTGSRATGESFERETFSEEKVWACGIHGPGSDV